MKYKKFKQHDEKDCGAACIRFIFSNFGYNISLAKCRELAKTDIQGTNIYGLVDAGEKINLHAEALEGSYDDLLDSLRNKSVQLPFICHVIINDSLEHYIVVLSLNKNCVKVFDPAVGVMKYSLEYFNSIWTGHIVTYSKGENFKHFNQNRNYYNEIKKMFFKQKKNIVFTILISLIIVSISITATLAYQYVIDNMLTGTSIESSSEESSHTYLESEEDITEFDIIVEKFVHKMEFIFNSINYLFIALILLYIIQALIQVLRAIILTSMSRKINLLLQEGFLKKVFSLKYQFFHNMHSGEIISRFQDIHSIRDVISNIVLTIVLDIIMIIAIVITLFVINNVLFILSLIMIGLFVIIFVCFKGYLERINRTVMQDNADLISSFKEGLDGIETVKNYNLQWGLLSNLYKKVTSFTSNLSKAQIIYSIQNSLTYLISSVGAIVILWLGSEFVLAGTLTLGELISFEMLITFLVSPLNNILELQPNIQEAFVAIDRLNDIMELEEENYSSNIPQQKFHLKGPIEFSNVYFRYGNRNLILNNISFKINPYEKIGVVGKSGCGKSTLAKLLMNLYSPESGEIIFNNTNINSIPLDDIRSQIIYIPQTPFLFSGTIKYNLTLGNNDIMEDELISVCRDCDILDFISSLPFEFNTVVEENGNDLSGGQKQRLALARALLLNPSILILDESTSQIDRASNKYIQNILYNRLKHTTCIIISHQIASLQGCDRIIVLDNGEIKAIDTHNNLVKNCSLYQELYY